MAIIENLDIETINWGKRGRISTNPQVAALKALGVRQALALTHEGYKDSQCTISKCALRTTLASTAIRNRPEVAFRFQHLPDGRLGIACFAKNE